MDPLGPELDGCDRFAASDRLRSIAHRIIPGGAHTYAKGDDQYPVRSPGFIVRGSGCRVVDVDGNEFVEYGSGARSIVLGHADARVNEAVAAANAAGSNFARPSVLEVEAAQDILTLFPHHDMVKFAKNGSDATTAAVRLARAATGRDMVAVCRDHPFFSTDDWFIGTTAMAAGIPQDTRDAVVGFSYGDLADLEALFLTYPGRIAAVVLEPETETRPHPGYLSGVASRCRAAGAVFVLDEIITGFRFHRAGVQTEIGVVPDLTTLGKALGNGYAVSALLGRRDLMELGGIDHDRERVFLLSTTHGAESGGLAAARTVMRIQREEAVIETLYRQGSLLRTGVNDLVAAAGLTGYVGVAGRTCNLVYVTKDREGRRSQAYRSLFMQELIRGGVLGPSFVLNTSHDASALDQTFRAVEQALVVYARALEDGVEPFLTGRPVQPVFRPRC
jgi:glutamate-1-semialdehyde 2,1-aminomutase